MRWERCNGMSLQRSTRSRAERPWGGASGLERRQRRLAMCLALIAGYVDAYGLSAFGTYVSFMSGNTTQVGSMTGHGRLVEAVPPALAILFFVCGSCAGTYLTHSRLRHSRRLLFGVVAALLAAAAGVSRIGPLEADAGLATISFSMGIMNTTLPRIGAESVSLTFMTGDLNRIGSHVALAFKGVPLPDPRGIGSVQRGPRAQGGAGRFRREGSAAGEMTPSEPASVRSRAALRNRIAFPRVIEGGGERLSPPIGEARTAAPARSDRGGVRSKP